MSRVAAADAADGDHGRFAAELARVAARTLPELAGAERHQAIAALDQFLAAPSPSRYLAAARTLADCRRATRARRLGESLAVKAHARALGRLRELPFLDDETSAALESLPIDIASGRRLLALAALLDAHAGLAARVRQADALRAPIR
jgi:hypothetical protein